MKKQNDMLKMKKKMLMTVMMMCYYDFLVF